MSGRPQEQRDQAVQQPRRTPLDFALGRVRYASGRRRHRRYGVVAALLVLAVGIGVVAVLLADWLTAIIK